MGRWVVLLVLLASSAAYAEGQVADIIGPVAKIRIDFPGDDRPQVFITDPQDIAAALKALRIEQRPNRSTSPPNEFFWLNLNFFDAQGVPHAVLGFYKCRRRPESAAGRRETRHLR